MTLGVSHGVVRTAERMLADAYELVLSGWCQGDTAQDAEHRRIEPSSAFARRWSAPGALERIWRRSDDRNGGALEAYERASLALAATVRDVPQHWNNAASDGWTTFSMRLRSPSTSCIPSACSPTSRSATTALRSG